MVAVSSAPCNVLLLGTRGRLLLFRVAEKATLADYLGHLRGHHFIPALIAAGDALEHVTRKDRQIFRVEIIELHEAAATYEVIIERLQLGFYFERVNGFQPVSCVTLQGIHINFQVILKESPKALQG